jgi:hypothetical protein
MPPAPAPESPELTAARERLAAAERTYAAAQAALSSWLHENAGRLAKAERADAARAIQGMIEREQKALEEGAPTPDAMRASNRKLATAIASDPSMREAAEIVYETLRRVPYAPVRARRWQDLNFLAPTFSDAVAELVRGGMVGVGEEQAALQEKVERAGKEAVAARTALEALEGPEASPPR